MEFYKNITHIKNRAKAIRYTRQLSRRLVRFLGKGLNKELKINLNNFQWNIILFTWVSIFVEIAFIKFYSKKKPSGTNFNIEDSIPLDKNEFDSIAQSKSWESFLSKEIELFKNNKSYQIKSTKIKKIKKFSIKNCLSNFYNQIAKFFIKDCKFFLSGAYLTKIQTIETYLYLNQLPIFKLSESKNKEFIINKSFRNKIFNNFKKKNNFEKFLINIILKFIPINYLENFKDITLILSQEKLKPKFIITAIDHLQDDYLKIFYSLNYKKTKLCVARHGSSFLNLDNHLTIFEKKISYKYLVQKPKGKKELFLPHYVSLFKKNNNNIDKICFIFYEPPLLDYLKDGPINDRNLKSMKYCREMLKILFSTFKEKLIIISNSKKESYYTDQIRKKYPHNFISGAFNFKNQINNCKLFVTHQPYTTFIQAFLNRPTILFLDNNEWINSKDFNKIKEEMKKNHIIFNNLNKFESHINKISKNPDNWWESPSTQKARDKFQKTFGLYDSTIIDYVNALKKLK